jgi:autotransporter-associated beta strand protein
MFKSQVRRRVLSRWQRVALAATAGLAGSSGARAGTYTWNAPNSGYWSAPSSWLEGVTPAGDTAAQLTFGPGAYSASNDISNLTLNSMTFNNADPTSSSIAIAGFSTLTLDGPSAGVYVTGGSVDFSASTLTTVNGAVISNAGAGSILMGSVNYNGPVTYVNSGSGSIIIPDSTAATNPVPVYSQANAVVNFYNTGTGQILIGGTGPTSKVLNTGLTGTVNIMAGTVAASNTTSDLWGNSLILNVAYGATFNFANNGETMGGIGGNGSIILGTAGLTLVDPVDQSFYGTISGTGAVTWSNINTLTWGGTHSFSGTTTVAGGGVMRLTGANVLSPNSVLSVSAGSIYLNGFNQTVAGLQGGNQSGSLDLGASTLSIIGTSTTARYWLSPIVGTGGITYNNPGVQSFLAYSTYSGPTQILNGTLRVAGNNLLTNAAGTTVASSGTLDIVLASNGTWAAPLSDTGGFAKEGSATLTFNTAQPNVSLTNLSVIAGTFQLDHTSDNGSMIGASPALSVGTAQFSMIGSSSAASGQSFSATSLTGAASVSVTSGNGQSATVALGAITRSPGLGSTIDFQPTNVGSGVASITTTTTNNTSGALGGYATLGGATWAVTGTGSATFTVTGLPAASYAANSWATGKFTDIATNAYSATSSAATGNVRFNTPVASTLTLQGNNTLTYGGILVTPSVGANATTIAGAGGATLKAPSGTDIVVQQFNAAAPLTISASIANVAGAATVVNGVAFTATASTQTITVPSTAGITLGEVVTTSGGLTTNVATSYQAHVVAIPSSTTVTLAYGTTPVAGTASTVTFTPGTNLVKSGPGQLILSNSNSFTGMLILNQGLTTAAAATTYGNSGSGSSSVYFNGGSLESTATLSGSSGLQPWIFGPAGGTVQVDSGVTVVKYGNTVWGTGNITLTGPGTFDIGSVASSWSGQLFVNNGIFRLTSNQVKSCNGITVASGAQYYLLDTTSGPFNVGPGASLTLNGNGPNNTGAWLHTLDEAGSANYAFNSQIILASTSRFTEQDRTNVSSGVVTSIDTCTDVFPLAIVGAGNLIKDGTGIMVLSNPFNAYGGTNGSTILSNGTMRLGVNNAMPMSTTLQFGETGSSNSALFDMAGYNQSVANLTTVGSGPAHQIANSSTTTGSTLTVNYNGASNSMFTSQIGGGTLASPAANNISLVKTGTGTLSLLGTTTYTGTATVAQGALRVTGNAVARPYVVNDGASLIVTNSDTTPLPATGLTLGSSGTTNLSFEFLNGTPASGAIAVSTAGGLSLNGTVNVAVSAVDGLTVGEFPLITYSGAIGGAGFSALSSTISLPNRVYGQLVNNAANNSIDLDITSVDFLHWSGAASANWDIATTANFTLNSDGSSQVYQDQPSPDTVAFDDTAVGSHTVNLTTVLNPAAVSVNTATGYTFTGSGYLASTTGLAVSGGGTLTVLTNNVNTGATVVNNATVQVGNGGTTGAIGTGNVTDNGALVFDRADNVTFAPNISGTGSFSTIGTGTTTLSGALNIAGNVTVAGGLVLNSGQVGGGIHGAGSLTKAGSGLLVVAGDVNNSGGVNIANGTLQIGNGGTTGTLASDVTVAATGVLGFSRSDTYTYTGAITGAGGVTVSSGDLALTGSLSYTGNTKIGANTIEYDSNSDFTMYGIISGTGTIIKSGNGQLTLLNSNTGFTGTMIINSGTVLLEDNGLSGDLNVTNLQINSGGKFIFGLGGIPGENPDFPDNTFVTVYTGGTFELRVGENYGGTSLQGGTYFVNNAGFTASGVGGPFKGFDAQSGYITGTGSGAISLTTGAGSALADGAAFNKSTTGTVFVEGAVAIGSAMPINILQGTLSFQGGNVPTVGTAAITLGGGSTDGTLQLSDAATGTIARPVILNSPNSNFDVLQPTGVLTLTGNVSGNNPVNKTGLGTLVLAGTNSFVGNVVAYGGTVQIQTPIDNTADSIVVPVGGATVSFTATAAASAHVVASQLGTISVAAGSTVSILGTNRPTLSQEVLAVNTLVLGGSFDLGNNDILVHGMSEAAVDALVGGGELRSSMAGTPGNNAYAGIAVVTNSDGQGGALFPTFDGLAALPTDVLVKYTYLGDTDLNGFVDASDLANTLAGMGGGLTGWANGDFNYDGVVNSADLTLLLNSLANQGTSFGGPTGGGGAVPEPSSLALAVAAVPFLSRRRRA